MEWIQILGPTILLLIGGLISWYLKDRTEALRIQREKFQQERLKIYVEILEPILGAFIYQDSIKKQSEAIAKVATDAYRKKSFELVLFGSDDVVKKWGEFMQHQYKNNAFGQVDLKTSLEKLGDFLISIRKDLGDKNTNLTNLELFKWMLKDYDQL